MNLLMAHQVAGYPDRETAEAAADAMIAAGAAILEIQIPFSDPTADGRAIQAASAAVLDSGFSVAGAFAFISAVHEKHPATDIFVMTYASIPFAYGIESFVKTAKDCGVSGFIIPDLPFDCDEGLGRVCQKYGVAQIPVVAPSMSDERLARVLAGKYQYIYTALRTGITGSKTVVTDGMLAFLKKCASGGARILGGFGITGGAQAAQIAPFVYAVVAGSVFVDIITDCARNLPEMNACLTAKVQELTGAV